MNICVFSRPKAWEGDNTEHARADLRGDRLDRATLAGGIPTFENVDDPKLLFLDPLLQVTEPQLTYVHLLLVILPLRCRRCLWDTDHRMLIFGVWCCGEDQSPQTITIL